MKVRWLFPLCLWLLLESTLALNSICPSLLTYKTTPTSAYEHQTWSAVVDLQQTTTNYLDIHLDRAITFFSTQHFDAVTSDWKKFHLTPRNLSTNGYLSQFDRSRMHLTVEFNSEVVPTISEIRLNGVRVCPLSTASTTSGSYRPSSSTVTSSSRTRTTPRSEDEDFFSRRTTERINYLNVNNQREPQDNNNNNNNYDPWRPNGSNNEEETRRTSPSTNRQPTSSRTTSTSTTARSVYNVDNDDWNNNRRPTQVTRYPTTRPTTTSTTTSGYFPGDLHNLFQQNGNDRRRSTENPLAAETCGQLSPSLNPLVVNGEAAHDGQFPWHAALYISQGVQLKYTCGGNLISSQLILTAAHCVTLKRTASSMNPEHLLIYLGKSDLLHWQGHEQDFSVEEIIIHPRYNHSRYYNDMALLKLKKRIRYTDYVRPVCLWAQADLKSVIGQVGRVPGWGYNENGVVGTQLSYVEMPIVTHETCIWSNRDVFSRITSDTSFCAGFRNGSNVCNGDSGGGMVFNRSGRWYLKGIVSVSVAIQNHFLCDPDHYVVFGDVSKCKDWIDQYL